MDIQKIKELALASGFSLKEQASGNMELHSYVYEFAQAVANEVKAQAVPRCHKGYYSHDGDNYQMHETLCQAKADALGAIEHYSEQLADGNFHPESDGNYQDISFGIVLGRSGYSLISVVTQQDVDEGECKYPVGTEILDLYLDDDVVVETKASAVPDGFVLVPKECSDEMAEVIAATARVCGGIAGDVYDAIVKQAMVEAAENEESLDPAQIKSK